LIAHLFRFLSTTRRGRIIDGSSYSLFSFQRSIIAPYIIYEVFLCCRHLSKGQRNLSYHIHSFDASFFFEVFQSYFACLASLFSRPELEYTIDVYHLTTPFFKKK